MIDKELKYDYDNGDCSGDDMVFGILDFLKAREEENTALGEFKKAEENKDLIKLLEYVTRN